jgi:uncharacterized coiled-coil DUF342 family protein
MPRGAGPKREREYRELEYKFEESRRYRGREKEVAAPIKLSSGDLRKIESHEKAHKNRRGVLTGIEKRREAA